MHHSAVRVNTRCLRRPVASRDRAGQPRCDRCPDRDERDPLAALTGIITRLDPSLPAGRVADAAWRVFARQGKLRCLAWAVEANPGLLTGDGAQAPTAAVLRLIDGLAGAGAGKIIRPACQYCSRGAVELPQLRRQGQRRAVQPLRNGPRAGYPRRRRQAAVPEPSGQRPGQPGRMRPLRTATPRQHPLGGRAGLPVVHPPDDRILQRVRADRPCVVSKTTGQPWCRASVRWQAECSRCGRLAAIRAGTRQAPLCAGCAVPDPGFWEACTACGVGGRLLAGICRRCQLHRQLWRAPSQSRRAGPPGSAGAA